MNKKAQLYLSAALCGICIYTPFSAAKASSFLKHNQAQDISVYTPVFYEFDAEPRYKQMVRQLLTHIPYNFNFGAFRRIYARTSFYDPIGEDARDLLLKHAFVVDTSENVSEVKEALSNYHDVLQTHLANINVVLQAIALSRTDKRLGNTEWLLKVKKGLLKNLLDTGDGKTLNTAYEVVTLAEETLLLSHLGFAIEDTAYKSQHMIKYHLHIGQFIDNPNPNMPNGVPLFVNVSIPMRHIEKQKEEKERESDLSFKGILEGQN